MENYGIMDNNEDLCKQEKNEEIKTDKSISFENFLKKKSISQETSNKNSLSPVRTNEISDKIFEKTPLAKKIDNNGNYSNSMKKIKKLIDSSFQKTEISEMQEDRPLFKNLIPPSYLDEEKNESKQKNEVNSKIYEDFASFQKNNEEDNNEILGEIELLNPKPQKKLRYPNLEVATKNIGENNENFKEDKIFFSENPFQEDSKQYKSLKEKKSDFTSFLSNLGWKSKSYLKSFDNHKGGSKEIELKFRYKQDLIKCLNAKICDFKDSETFLKGNIEKFRLEEKKRDNLFSKTKIDSYNSIEKKWIEKINILKSTEKEKKDNLDFDLKYILKNSKMKNKLY